MINNHTMQNHVGHLFGVWGLGFDTEKLFLNRLDRLYMCDGSSVYGRFCNFWSVLFCWYSMEGVFVISSSMFPSLVIFTVWFTPRDVHSVLRI